MPRNVISKRIARWIRENHEGKVRPAARALGVDHVSLWRASNGHFTRPPYAVLEKLAAHTRTPLADWLAPSRRDA